MSDAIRQLAEERRRRYQSLSASEKPSVAVCASCGEATYKKEVCPATGLFHDLEKKRLVGGSVVEGSFITSSQLMGAIERTRVKWVASRTQLVKADAQSLNIFQSFVAQMDWNLQRYGILYGRYDAESHTIEVHAVYEPEQHGNRYTFEVLEDKRIAVVDQIAAGLGLRRVGVMCSHPPRDPNVCLLSSREMLLCAREQSRFGDECVLLTIAPRCAEPEAAGANKDYPVSPTSATSAQMVVECQAWQTSPQCVYLYRLGLLHEPGAAGSGGTGAAPPAAPTAPPTSPPTAAGGGSYVSGRLGEATRPATAISGQTSASGASASAATPPPPAMRAPEEACFVASTLDLEVTQQDFDRNGKERFVTKAPSKLVDTRWFTSYIAVQQFESNVVRGLFMRISRPGMAPPTFANLRNYFLDPKRRGGTFAEKIADFHVLIFLAGIFSAEDDLPTLVKIAATRQMTEEARNYEAILDAYMQS